MMATNSAPIPRRQSSRRRRRKKRARHIAIQIYTHSYLILFSILGTLARFGLQALNRYPGTPVTFGVLWANVGGSFIMGFLAEDRQLFHDPDHTAPFEPEIPEAQPMDRGDNVVRRTISGEVQALARKAHHDAKKAIPLYIGLTTGFCGSFTSFSTFIGDMFLAAANDLPIPGIDDGISGPERLSRSGGYSFLATLAVLITTVALSLSSLVAGVHSATALHSFTPSIPFHFTRRYLNRLAVIIAICSWLAAVFLAIYPPHDRWRGQAIFALVFAPPGCLLRYHLAVWLNARIPSFPLGTFVANILGTAILSMAYDLIHAPVGGVIGCQVLYGLEGGFCGSLTTVSTWVAELASLRRRHAYVYGAVSVLVAFAVAVAVMGGMRWGPGFKQPLCIT